LNSKLVIASYQFSSIFLSFFLCLEAFAGRQGFGGAKQRKGNNYLLFSLESQDGEEQQ
jgi:hypothetical protein